MPIYFLRRLPGKKRTTEANRQLGLILTFVVGAANAGGFLAIRRYTSHVTGIVASMADDFAIGDVTLALAGLGAVLAFLAGAVSTAALKNWARRKLLRSEYAPPLVLEALLLLCFGFLGATLSFTIDFFVSETVMLLCFCMGLQNATITKISDTEIRTTHVMGLVTEIGIELGNLFYWNVGGNHTAKPFVVADRQRLKLLVVLLPMFFLGDVAGAGGFKYIRFSSTIPLAALLTILAAVPILDDVALRWEN